MDQKFLPDHLAHCVASQLEGLEAIFSTLRTPNSFCLIFEDESIKKAVEKNLQTEASVTLNIAPKKFPAERSLRVTFLAVEPLQLPSTLMTTILTKLAKGPLRARAFKIISIELLDYNDFED